MRRVYENPEEGAAKGRAARQLMTSRYSPSAVAALVAAELDRVKASIRCGQVWSSVEGWAAGRSVGWGRGGGWWITHTQGQSFPPFQVRDMC